MPHPSRPQPAQTPSSSWTQNPTGLWLPSHYQPSSPPVLLSIKQRKPKRNFWGVRGKTLWDWLSLLLIPFLVGTGTILITYQQTLTQNALSDQQHKTDLKIAQEARWDDLLNDYRTGINTLILSNDLRRSQPGDNVRDIAHSLTLDVLNAVDDTRRDDVLLYLYSLHLIQTSFADSQGHLHEQPAIISLSYADLSHAHLNNADLSHTLQLHLFL